jgi:hypothetical protein
VLHKPRLKAGLRRLREIKPPSGRFSAMKRCTTFAGSGALRSHRGRRAAAAAGGRYRSFARRSTLRRASCPICSAFPMPGGVRCRDLRRRLDLVGPGGRPLRPRPIGPRWRGHGFSPWQHALGHVAQLSRVIDARTCSVRHSNWSPINGRRGQIEDDVPRDRRLAGNDWSEVRVWYDRSRRSARTRGRSPASSTTAGNYPRRGVQLARTSRQPMRAQAAVKVTRAPAAVIPSATSSPPGRIARGVRRLPPARLTQLWLCHWEPLAQSSYQPRRTVQLDRQGLALAIHGLAC